MSTADLAEQQNIPELKIVEEQQQETTMGSFESKTDLEEKRCTESQITSLNSANLNSAVVELTEDDVVKPSSSSTNNIANKTGLMKEHNKTTSNNVEPEECVNSKIVVESNEPQSNNVVLEAAIDNNDKLCFDTTSSEDHLGDVNDAEEDSATESLPPPTTEELLVEPHDRSDGSDSGLGSELCEERAEIAPAVAVLGESDSETSFLDRINNGGASSSTSIVHSNTTNFENFTTSQKSMIIQADFEMPSTSFDANTTIIDSENNILLHDILLDAVPPQPSKSSLKRKLFASHNDDDDCQPKLKKKRGISFDSVTVFYFPRAQGFACIPSQGGSTLGMGAQHSHVRKFSINEHANEQRRIHRQVLQQLRSERHVTTGGSTGAMSSDESDSEEEPSSDASESEMDLDNYYFLQPVPIRQRRVLLRSAGVRKIDVLERDECRDIRSSREFCGCGCKGYCDPDTCSCSQAGVKCQVDRLNFPCGCSRDNCGNSTGRIEFNPVRVRTHFIHTLMRLELEKKQEKEDEMKLDKKGTSPHWMNNERLLNVNYQLKANHQQQPDGQGTSNIKMNVKFNNSNLFRNVNLNSHEQVEHCMHNGNSFTNLHYGAPGEGPGQVLPSNPAGFTDLPAREDSLDLYTFREDCYGDDTTRDGPVVGAQSVERKQHQSFSSTLVHGFHFPDPRFPDVGFPGGGGAAASSYPPTTNQYTQPYQSSFTDFTPVFNSYGAGGGGYNPEFGTKALEGSFQQPSTNNGYDNFANDHFSTTKDNQYASLNPIIGANNKIESFSDLLNGRYHYSGYEETNNFSGLNQSDVNVNADDNNGIERTQKSDTALANNATQGAEDCGDENFGEIIKKTMVDTTST